MYKRWLWIVGTVFVLVRLFFAVPYTVPSRSMQPTVIPGDRILTLVSYYGLRLPWQDNYQWSWSIPKRGDVLVFRRPGTDTTYIKRVVAIGGDTLRVQGAHLIINGAVVPQSDASGLIDPEVQALIKGTLLKESLPGASEHLVLFENLPSDTYVWPNDNTVRTLSEGEFFMMGDHRDHSSDSRSFGPIKMKHVMGKAWRVVWSYPQHRPNHEDETNDLSGKELKAEGASEGFRWFRIGSAVDSL